MKKILLASTMLVATGSMAAAEVTFGGFGRFGLFYEENDGSTDRDETRIEQRFRLNITGTTETDGGVKFGARMRIESNDNGDGRGAVDDDASAVVRAPEFNVTSGGFRLDVGNTSDVIDSGDVVNYYGSGVGLTSFLEQSSGFSLPASGISGSEEVDPTVKIRYSMGDFTVAASYSANAIDDGTADDREEYQIGFGYNFGNYSAGIAFGNEDDAAGLDNDFWTASFSGAVGSVDFSLLVADSDDQDDTSFGASVNVPVGASTSIQAVVADNGVDGDDTAYGVGFRHSLGGGVSLRGGVGSNSSDNTVADLGVVFNF